MIKTSRRLFSVLAAMVVLLVLGTDVLRCEATVSPVSGDAAAAKEYVLPDFQRTVPVELRTKLSDVGREIGRLRKAGQGPQADKLQAKLQTVMEQIDGPLALGEKAPSELHVVGLYEGLNPRGMKDGVSKPGTADVSIDYAGQPIVLALCSYSPVKWQVTLGKGVKLTKVILGGYHNQQVAGLPKDVAVENFSGKGSRHLFFVHNKQESAGYLQAVRELRAITNLEIATFQGLYRYKGVPFVIGPEHDTWRFQLIGNRLAPLHRQATQYARAQRRKQMQPIRFHAAYFTATAKDLAIHRTQGAWGEFTPAGPIANSLQPLPANLKHIAVDPKGPNYYAIKSHGVLQFDIKQNDTTDITPNAGGGLPKLSWPCGLTFDTKRRRLMLSSIGGKGFLYAYAVDEGKWSLVTSLNNIGLQSLTYSAEEDVLYGFGLSLNLTTNVIYTFSHTGEVLRSVKLAKRILSLQRLPHGGTQIIAVGRQVVIISNPAPDIETPGEPIVSRSYLVDPRTGKVLYSDVLQPHAGLHEFKPDELGQLWTALLSVRDDEADRLMWKMAAGEDQTVAFLTKQFKPLPQVDDRRIKSLITQLNDEKFKTRQTAFNELVKLGEMAAAQLKAAATEDSPAEVRTRARRLLDALKRPESRPPTVRRDIRAVRILGRIGTPKAAARLKQLADESPTAIRATEARNALQRIRQR